MNRLKKYASLLLALVMALALAVPAMATEASGPAPVTGPFEITITNATTGHTYEAYQIFKGDLSAANQTATDLTAPVLSNIEWGAGVNAELALAAAKTVLEDTTLATAAQVAEKLTESNAAAFAQAMKAALTEANGSATAESDTVKITATAGAGYYLIKDSKDSVTGDGSVTLFMLQVVGPTAVKAKAGTPTPDKKIVEGENKVNTGDYDIGEDITFELSAELGNGYENYNTYKLVFHDTMSKGLTYDETQGVTISILKKDATAAEAVDTTGKAINSTVVKNDDGTTTLTVTFTNLKADFKNLATGDKVLVTYHAKLNDKAAVGNPGNPNTMHLEFSNNPNDEGDGETGETPDKEVIVFTYELDADKVDGKDKTTALEGAEFVLKNAQGNGEGVQYAVINAVTGKFIRWSDSRIDETNDAGETTKLVSTIDSTGKAVFKVSGIDAGTYWLEETKAPVGYNLPNPAETKLTITATIKDNNGVPGEEAALTYLNISVGEETVDPEKPGNGVLADGIVNTTIENNKGATLPETGGIGTTIFYALGGLLTVGAVVLLVTKKRMSADEK